MNKNDEEIIVSRHDAAQGTLKRYTSGFVLSLLLTFAALYLTEAHIYHGWLSKPVILGFIVSLALVQLGVQLVYFLHLNRESKPHWNLTVLVFALMIVVVVVGGSIWIMYNLNYHMTTTQQQNYMHSQDGL